MTQLPVPSIFTCRYYITFLLRYKKNVIQFFAFYQINSMIMYNGNCCTYVTFSSAIQEIFKL
jgi:hypothetical protein